MLFRIADSALFSTHQKKPNSNNSKGAILLQIIFQIFQGGNCLDEFFDKILDRVVLRLDGFAEPMFKKHLLQVFLAAIIYNSRATINYIENKGLMESILIDIINIKSEFESLYEQKIFVIGISKLLGVDAIPVVSNTPLT